MIGSEESVTSAFMASFEEAQRLNVFSQLQALTYIGSKIRQRQVWGRARSKLDDARELLAHTILAHVPVSTTRNVMHLT